MEYLVYRAGVILTAVVLDRLLGDPQWLPHPVRLIGLLISAGERLRSLPLPLRFSGMLLAVVVIAVTGAAVWGLLHLAYQQGGRWCGLVLETLLVYLAIAPRSLAEEALAVDRHLRQNDLPLARTRLAMIVGRDTGRLDEQAVRQATVETVGENAVDGMLSPLFYAAFFGPVGVWVYKAVSTLDSMVGYRNERYRHFGWASARLDDLAAFLPARLALLLIPPAAFLVGLSAGTSWRVGWRDRLAHTSPNAGHGEALFAGALRVRLGGAVSYGGVAALRPYLGWEFPSPGPEAVRQAVTLLWSITWLFTAAIGILLLVIAVLG